MNKLLLVLLVLFISISVFAESKIGIVDMQRVIMEVNQGKAAMEKLKTEAEKQQKVMKEKEKDLMALEKELKDLLNNPAADKAKILEKQKNGQEKLMLYQQEAQKIQSDLSKKEQKAAGEILEKAQKIILDVTKKEGFEIILNKAAVLYAPNSIDITNQVIREYDKVNK